MGVHGWRNDGPSSPPASTGVCHCPQRMAPNLAPRKLTGSHQPVRQPDAVRLVDGRQPMRPNCFAIEAVSQ
jgi:hypothetical protein